MPDHLEYQEGRMVRTYEPRDLGELAELVRNARGAMLSIEAEPSRNLKELFPAMWCEHSSIVIAETLLRRGLGAWTFVAMGHRDGPNGHAWLELRDEGENRLVTIDATIDQFDWGRDLPFVSATQTRAATEFTVPRYSGPWQHWPVLERDSSFLTYAEAFVRQSGLI
ncbi:hypothetical protein [Demequina muriae]|uniref:Microcin J25-processing protein McjB C-terminal domain-containing protein n=1 Tax=Demequina muriae TaxID=3051664 RepID=A0ABT8GJL7_9MICO|nr:hypothetical protein [Demequina sp. EGI L300058]MDN4481620.1 hypothetical protein [Demequina sp. EGI L300058]